MSTLLSKCTLKPDEPEITSFLVVLKNAIFFVGRWIQTHNGFVSALATVVMAAFTGILWWTTRNLWKASQEQSRQLKRSVDSLQNSERANLFVTVQHPEDMPIKSFSEFTVINTGRTHAILTNINSSYERIAHGEPIPEISPDGDHGIMPDTIIISPGADSSKTFVCPKSQAFRNDHRLICIGRIQYKDIFEVPHETGFCWEYLFYTNNFHPVNDPKYNYHT